jgi:nucleoid-associated protein EbfC
MDISKMMEAATQMQAKMQAAQADIEQLHCDGQSGAGLVKVTVNGAGKVLRLAIDASLFKPEDKEVVEDLIVAAINDGQKKAGDMAQAQMAKLTAGLPLPPGLKLPF